jgi:hypothetical protein
MSKRQDRQASVERALAHHVETGTVAEWCYSFNGSRPPSFSVWARTLDMGKSERVLSLDDAEHLCLLLARAERRAPDGGRQELAPDAPRNPAPTRTSGPVPVSPYWADPMSREATQTMSDYLARDIAGIEPGGSVTYQVGRATPWK